MENIFEVQDDDFFETLDLNLDSVLEKPLIEINEAGTTTTTEPGNF